MPRPSMTHAATALPAALLGGLLAALLVCSAWGCTYRREISRSGILTNLSRSMEGGAAASAPTAPHPVFGVPGGKLRVEDEETGEVTLYAKRIKHLMNHIISTIENEEPELFVDQVLSSITKGEYAQRGLDPVKAFETLSAQRRDVYALFAAMPMGEGTPGLLLEQIGHNMFRLKVPRSRHPELRWIGIDASFEGGNYTLRWFVD